MLERGDWEEDEEEGGLGDLGPPGKLIGFLGCDGYLIGLSN